MSGYVLDKGYLFSGYVLDESYLLRIFMLNKGLPVKWLCPR